MRKLLVGKKIKPANVLKNKKEKEEKKLIVKTIIRNTQ